MSDALGHASRVDEHERRAVRFDQFSHAVVDLRPDLVRHDRFKRRTRNLQAQIARALMARVDNRNLSRRLAIRRSAGQQSATASIGFCVAERPMRNRRSPQRAARRSSERARCAPRLLGATAWISSTITERAVASIRDRTPSRAARRAIPASSPGYEAGGAACAPVRRAACHQFGPRCGCRLQAARSGAAARLCPPAELRDCGGCRSTAP